MTRWRRLPAEPGQRWQGHGGGELLRILTGVLKSGGGTLCSAPARSGCAWKATAASDSTWSSKAGP